MTSGAYKTSLVSYLTHRDLFPSLMKVLCAFDLESITNLTTSSMYKSLILHCKCSNRSFFWDS